MISTYIWDIFVQKFVIGARDVEAASTLRPTTTRVGAMHPPPPAALAHPFLRYCLLDRLEKSLHGLERRLRPLAFRDTYSHMATTNTTVGRYWCYHNTLGPKEIQMICDFPL